ncbi:DNA alkylation repair protein [Sphingomonas colocasiae]|uniref:DNA alkylation repair protein n=1 Tax=Sphingomonas colocasiae TaxID=1848973 RepID=A0ABS7PY75_9SPHN|nr:DNA alkylation repair protein [Sphingomonas colocasiae]MBY8826312.1 DNA alkylation repair protein [Sphingomonas colocasiae]
MTLKDVLGKLEALGNEKVRALNIRNGADERQYGVKLGDIRAIAKSARPDHALAMQLWETGNLDARLLAILWMKPRALSAAELDLMVRSNRVIQLSDWLNAYIVKLHPEKEALRRQWMESADPMAARAGWSLTAERIAKHAEDLDLAALLDRIERQLAGAAAEPQWTMNMALANIGIHHPGHRARALAIGETLGVYRDYPTSPGCTSPFAPIWIDEIVRRQAPRA